MNLTKVLGYSLIAAPFVVIFEVSVILIGWIWTAAVMGAVAMIISCIAGGLILLDRQ